MPPVSSTNERQASQRQRQIEEPEILGEGILSSDEEEEEEEDNQTRPELISNELARQKARGKISVPVIGNYCTVFAIIIIIII